MENLQNQMQGLNVHHPVGRPPRHKRPAHAYHQDLNQAPLAHGEPSHGFDPRLVPSQAPQPSTGYVRTDVAAKQIPSLPELREADQALWRTVPFCTWDNRTSYPSSQTDYTCIDQGNSSPKFARLTLPLVPATAETLEKTELPLAVVLQPLAEQRPEEMP